MNEEIFEKFGDEPSIEDAISLKTQKDWTGNKRSTYATLGHQIMQTTSGKRMIIMQPIQMQLIGCYPLYRLTTLKRFGNRVAGKVICLNALRNLVMRWSLLT